MSNPLTQDDLKHWQEWIGRTEARTQTPDMESLRRFACAIGEPRDVETHFPSLGHWAFFLPTVDAADIGADGHPRRGGFLPPVSLPRRMFAAARMSFDRPIAPGVPATLTSTIHDVRHRSGRSGDLVFVEVARVITQEDQTCLTEVQTLVYRNAGADMDAVVDAGAPSLDGAEAWCAGPVDLFRFSAVTFNSHRIHYDLPYTTTQEGYPGLVVHGPFTAAKLFGFARRTFGRSPRGFEFRGLAPIIADQSVILARDTEDDAVRAVRCDGQAAMTAKVSW